jgi:hypothetical protein
MATKRPMSAEITAELLDAFNGYVSTSRYIKYRAIEAAFKLFMAVPETLQLKLMRDDVSTGDLDISYTEKAVGNSKRKKHEVEISSDGSGKSAPIDKKELESIIKQAVQSHLKAAKS